MRRFLFDWHLTMGKAAGALIILWSLSGAAMIMDPIARRWLDPVLPKLAPAPLPEEAYRFPVSRLPLAGATGVSLRAYSGRAWYEVRRAGGRVDGYDAATGAPARAEILPEEAVAVAAAALGERWRVASADRLDAHDDDYRSGDLPVVRVSFAGPGAPRLYLSARDGSPLKTSTRASRAFRWLGLGLHTWNLQAIKKGADDLRRWSLTLLICLPLAALGVIAYALLYYRRRQVSPRAPSRRAAALVCAALILAPSPSFAQAAGRARPVTIGLLPLNALPSAALPPVLPSAASLPPLSPLPLAAGAFVPNPTVAPALARAAVAVPFAARAPLAAMPAPAAAPVPSSPSDSVESSAVQASVRFDGAGVRAEGAPVAPSAFSAASAPLPPFGEGTPDAARAPRAPEPPSRPADRKALWGIYLTHGAHLTTLSAAWRVAWPLLALDALGKAGLAAIGSTGALLEMGTGLVAGALVDRLLPRRSMAAAAVVRAGVSLAIVAALSSGAASFPFLFGAFVAHAFALTTIHIGQSSAAPQAAGDAPGALRRVNATLKIVTAAVSIPGSLVGGWVVGVLGAPWALAAYAAANALVLAPMYWFLFPKSAPAAPSGVADSATTAAGANALANSPAPAPKGPGLWEAAKLVLTSRLLLGALAAMALGVLLVEPLRTTTLPILAKELSPATAAMLLGSFQAAFHAGQFAGNLALIRWGKRLSDRNWLLVGAGAMASFALFLFAPVHAGFGLAAAALIGLLSQPVSVVAKTMFQEEVRRLRPDLLGRAMGVNNIFYRLAVSAGTALVGWATIAGAALAFGATGTLAAAYGLAGAALVAAVLWLLRPPSGRGRNKEAAGGSLGGRVPYRTTRELARDAAAEKLAAAGLPELLRKEGLTLWHILPHRSRSGEQVYLTFGLPPDGRPFERGSGDPERRAELSRRLEAARERITALVAATLGLEADRISLQERLVEGCCGAGCESCLLTKPEHAERWTGLKKGPARLGGWAALPLAFALPATAGQWHALAGHLFGALVLVYTFTGTASLLTPWLKSKLDARLPAAPASAIRPEFFPLSPAAAARALTPEERAALKPGQPVLRAVPGAPAKRWYEFALADGRVVDVHARTGRRMRTPRSGAFAFAQVRRWLAGSAWSPRGKAVLLTEQGDHYRKGEMPHYRVDLDGPGGWQVFVSAKDGRVLEAHSRLSRALKWLGKGPHAWGIKALDRHDRAKRFLAPVLLGLPLLSIAATAFWTKLSHGWHWTLPALDAGAGAWHAFLGTWSLFALAFMAVTGPLILLMPLLTKKTLKSLPKTASAGPEAFVLSPAEAAARLSGAEIVSVKARATRTRAWYEFALADGSARAVSAADGALVEPFLSAAEAEAEARAWLAGSRWTPRPGAELLADFDAHYKDFRGSELPVYRVKLDGPGRVWVHLSARDGRPVSFMGARSLASRLFGALLKAGHAFEWGPFERHPALRRAAVFALLVLPLALTVLLGLLL